MIRRLHLLFLLVFISSSLTVLTAQTDIMITGDMTITLDVVGGVNTTYNIIMPPKCTANVTYEAWGGGGAGGIQRTGAVGGGGSGAYVNCNIVDSLDCGTTYTVTVGAGGIPDGANSDGGSTIVSFRTTSSTAGGGVTGSNGGATRAGGTATGCGSIGSDMDSNMGSGRVGNTGGVGGAALSGGLGGVGGTIGNSGSDGATPGGGGGGHGRGNGIPSGKGGDGRIIIEVTGYRCINAVAPDITVCTEEPVTDLTSYDPIVLDDEMGTVTWYNQDPATTGTTISTPTAFDLSTIAATDLWAKVTLSGSVMNCMDTINVPINITSCNKWTGAVDNDWNNAGNWSTGVVPVTADNVLINKSGATITSTSKINIGGLLTVGPCVTLDITGADASAMLVLSGSLINKGDITITNTVDRRAMFVTAAGYVLNNGNIEGINATYGIDNRGAFTNNGVVISDSDLDLRGVNFINNTGGEVFTGTENFNTGATTVKTGEVADAVKLVMTAPTATTTTLEVCDINNDNIAEFTLTDADATVLGGQTGLTVSYHLTQLDADCDLNPLSSPYENTTETCQTIYARVGLSASGCYATVPITLKVINGIDLFDAPFIICDTETTTNLSENNAKILGGQAGTVAWFDGMPSTGTALGNTTDLNMVGDGDLWAKVTLSGLGCMDSINVATIIQTDCITWTGAANDYNWDTPTNWSGGTVPDNDACIKINDSDCPITKTGGISVTSPGLLSIGEGVHLIITGGSGTGLSIRGRLDNKGMITIESGYSNGIVVSGGKLNNAACASIVTQGSSQGIFVNNSSIALVNDGVIESMGGRGMQTQGPSINNGTIVSSPDFRLNIGASNTGSITNNGQIFSVLDSVGGTYNGNAFEALGTCPTISSTITDVCIGDTITITADKGTFTSNNTNIAEVDATSGALIGKTAGTVKITVTDGTCTIQRLVTVHSPPTPIATNISVCGYGAANLITNNTTILNGETGSVIWYNKEPADGGTIITNPTEFDINTLTSTSDLWVIVALDDCTACTDTLNIPYTPTFCGEGCENSIITTWTGATSTDWNDPSNWSNNMVPRRTDEVRFTSSAHVTGTPPNAIDRLRISGGADVSFELTNLTVSRIAMRTGAANSVDILGGGSLSLVTGEYLFTTNAASCDAINDIMRVRNGAKFNINRGVRATYRTGGAPKGTTRDALVIEDENSCVVNCGLILIDGGFTGNGITVDDGSSFYNNGNITIEPVITGSSILVTNESSFINECLASIYNNNISNSKITINRESFFRNFGFIRSSNPNGAGISVVQGGNRAESVLFNYGYFYNKNNFSRIATGSGAVVDEGQRTTIDNLHDLLREPGIEFTRCSGANLGCGSDTINPIPTMNEWGILIFALLLLNLGIFFISRKENLSGGNNYL